MNTISHKLIPLILIYFLVNMSACGTEKKTEKKTENCPLEIQNAVKQKIQQEGLSFDDIDYWAEVNLPIFLQMLHSKDFYRIVHNWEERKPGDLGLAFNRPTNVYCLTCRTKEENSYVKKNAIAIVNVYGIQILTEINREARYNQYALQVCLKAVKAMADSHDYMHNNFGTEFRKPSLVKTLQEGIQARVSLCYIEFNQSQDKVKRDWANLWNNTCVYNTNTTKKK